MTRMTLADAAILSLVAFLVLVAISTVLDGLAKLKRARVDAELLRDSSLRYCRADVELAIDAAVHRASVLRRRSPERELEPELRELVVSQVLEDLDAGHLAHAGMEAVR